MEVVTGAAEISSGQAGGTSFFLVRKVAAVTGNDLRNASVGLDENNRPAVMFSLKPDAARSSARSRAPTSAARWRSCSTTRCSRIRASRAGSPTKAGSPATSRSRKRRTSPSSCVGRAAGIDELFRGARRRPDPRPRLDSRRRHRLARRPGARHRLHARLLQAVRHQRHRRDGRQPDHPARAAWPGPVRR